MTFPIHSSELEDARKGTLYFLGKIEIVRRPSFELGLISNFVGGTSILSDLKCCSVEMVKSVDAGRKIINGIDRFTKPIKDVLASFFDKMTEHFAVMYGESSDALEWIGEFGSWAVSTLVGSLSDIIPGWGYVNSASDLYDGIKQAVTSAVKWLGQVYSGWGVKLLEGGPVIMASAIARHNVASLAGGLKDIALSTTKIALQAAGDAAAGVGSIINMITGILQRIAKLVGYCVQRFLLNRTMSQARYHWNNKAELITDQDRFNEWFKKSCSLTPIIAALTLQSGFAAHPLRFMSLIKSDGDTISLDAFNKGVDHINKLKESSKQYVNEYTNRYKLNFSSADPVVSSRLNQIFV